MVESIRRILALVRKELLTIFKDPRGRSSLFIPPILQCLLYGYAATYDLSDVPYALLDEDGSASSRELLARLDGSRIFRRVADVREEAELADEVNERRALLAVRIERDFERNLLGGRRARVQVIADGRNSNTAAVAFGYVNAIVEDFGRRHGGAEATAAPAPVRVTSRAWFNPNLETRWNMIPALLGTLTMLQTVLLTALSVAREREQGTFDQLLVTPLTAGEVMAGKAIPSILVGLVQATSVLVVAQLWFRIPFAGSFLTLYAGLGLFLVAAVGLGLLVSAFAANMQQAMLFSFSFIMPFILLSGLSTPIGNMPRPLQAVTMLNPLRYAIDIARSVYLEGAGIDLLAPDLWPLAVIGALTLSIAAWTFRRRMT
jgi:pyoluteorin transport system permease protein